MIGRIRILAAVFVLVLSACGTGEVREVSPSTFVVSSQYGSLNGSWDRAQQEANAKAMQYCEAKGEQFILIDEKRAGVLGYSPQSSTITFSCGPDTRALLQTNQAQCKDDTLTPELDPIRHKVELHREFPESPPPFEIASNDTFPSEAERKVIARWATIREECDKRYDATSKIPASATPLQVAFLQQDRSFGEEARGRVGGLIVTLYQQKLTYGEFAQKRYEITREAAAAERQYRQATLISDQQRQMQAQQMAQQQFQNNLMAWSTYMQAVSARQPQTVHLDGSVRLQSNCTSQRIGNTVTTNCN
jgi:hypothetical protein